MAVVIVMTTTTTTTTTAAAVAPVVVDGVGLSSSGSRVRNGSSVATKESLLSVDPPGDAPSWTVPVKVDGYAPSNLLCIVVAQIPRRIIFKRNRDFLRGVIPRRFFRSPQYFSGRGKHFHQARLPAHDGDLSSASPSTAQSRRHRDARYEVKKNAPD